MNLIEEAWELRGLTAREGGHTKLTEPCQLLTAPVTPRGRPGTAKAPALGKV